MTIVTKTKPTVAEYLADLIQSSSRSEQDIAVSIGHDNPKALQMFGRGLVKLPLSLIAPLAHALEVDPGFLLRMVLNEYMPDALPTIEATLQLTALTRNERELIDAYRRTVAGTDAYAVVADARDLIAVVMV